MIIFPAIDLRAGCVVRLRQGRPSEQTIYSDDPAAVAARWRSEGATWLHIVDLDAALGSPHQLNTAALKRILQMGGVQIQFGGGLRDLSSLALAFEMGIERAVIGTMAVENPDVLAQAVSLFGAERILVAVDTRDGSVTSHGWLSTSQLHGVQFGKQMWDLGIRRALVTDISNDGMMTGIDALKLAAFARETGLGVIASGGIGTLDDVRALVRFESEGIDGAIVGQALYSGALSLREMMELAQLSA